MSNIVLDNITNTLDVNKININFTRIESKINNELVHNIGGNNQINQDIDMNGYTLLNVKKPSSIYDVVRLKELNDAVFGNNVTATDSLNLGGNPPSFYATQSYVDSIEVTLNNRFDSITDSVITHYYRNRK